MKLCYRGVSYQANPHTVKTVATGMTASYRGQTYQVRRSDNPAITQPARGLKYRGVTYPHNQAIDNQPVAQIIGMFSSFS